MSWKDDVHAAVRLIPRGRVAAYVDVATFLGHPQRPRQVGNALAALDAETSKTVPWQRVVNAVGYLSIRGDFAGKDRQRALLLSEGVAVDDDYDVVDFATVRWRFPLPDLERDLIDDGR
ncbi:MAG TPA: MGMT family protein [Myxococcota bacterium]